MDENPLPLAIISPAATRGCFSTETRIAMQKAVRHTALWIGAAVVLISSSGPGSDSTNDSMRPRPARTIGRFEHLCYG